MIPGSANSLLLKSAAAAGGYQIERSLRFNSSDSGYLSRTPAVAGNRRTWTWAGWVKNAFTPSAYPRIFSAGSSSSNTTEITLLGTGEDNELRVLGDAGGVRKLYWTTANKFRDPSAWFHLVVALDTTQATTANRLKVYINGAQVTTAGAANTLPSQNDDFEVNNNSIHYVGRSGPYSQYMNGYLADIHFIDGQALTPSSFTEVSATTGQLIPKAYTGSFGTNGFWLKFSDNSAATATTLGKDYSGNSNNWTPNNLSVTAGAGNDSLVDTPTSYGTDTSGVGGSVRGNYCTLNPLSQASTATLANGNLDWSTSSSYALVAGTIAMPASGKWYWEITPTTAPTSGIYNQYTGVVENGTKSTNYIEQFGVSNAYAPDGKIYFNGGSAAYGNTWVANDVIGVAVDLDNGAIYYSKNGTWQNSGVPTSGSSQTGAARTNLSGKVLFPAIATNGTITTSSVFNFGQRPFAYTAPSGFKALCDTNLPAPVVAKPNTVMDVLLWTGNGSNPRSLTGLNFSPDLVWIKGRQNMPDGYPYDHTLFDTVRGASKDLRSNNTGSEATNNGYGYLDQFDSAGFRVTNGSTDDYYVNEPNKPYVAWAWDAGSSTVSNTQGSITSSVRANASSGFSVVTFTSPTGTGNFSVGHGLGVTPEFVIVKSRDAAGVWYVYHKSLATDYYLRLNGTNAAATDGVQWGAGMTSSVLGLRASYSTVSGATTVAYAWTPVAGYSSFGSYTGNGSADGPFVFTGHRSRWLMVKRSDSGANDWYVLDTARSTYNVAINELLPNSNSAENPYTGVDFDLLSNGFKIRATEGSINASGGTFIYASFAESPLQYARAR